MSVFSSEQLYKQDENGRVKKESVMYSGEVKLGFLVNMQFILTVLSRHKQTGILPSWIYGTCAIFINSNCHVQVKVIMLAFPKTSVSAVPTNTNKTEILKICTLEGVFQNIHLRKDGRPQKRKKLKKLNGT